MFRSGRGRVFSRRYESVIDLTLLQTSRLQQLQRCISSSSSNSRAPALSFELNDNFLRFYVKEEGLDINAEPQSFDYHYFWLRHNCDCKPHCRHAKTGERIVDSSEIPMSITPSSVSIDPIDKKIKIVWKGDYHQTEYEWDWLKKHSYGRNRHATSAPPPADLSAVELQYRSNGTTHEDYLKHCARSLKQFGLVVVRNRGMDTEDIM